MPRLFTFILGPQALPGAEKGELSLTHSRDQAETSRRQPREKRRLKPEFRLCEPEKAGRRGAEGGGALRRGAESQRGASGPPGRSQVAPAGGLPGPALPGRGACGIKAAGKGRARELQGTGGASVGAQGRRRRLGPGKTTR